MTLNLGNQCGSKRAPTVIMFNWAIQKHEKEFQKTTPFLMWTWTMDYNYWLYREPLVSILNLERRSLPIMGAMDLI